MDPRTELVSALNNAIVEQKGLHAEATAHLFTVVRDQTESSPLTSQDWTELKNIIIQTNQRAQAVVIWTRRAKRVGIAGGIIFGLADVVQAVYLLFHFMH